MSQLDAAEPEPLGERAALAAGQRDVGFGPDVDPGAYRTLAEADTASA